MVSEEYLLAKKYAKAFINLFIDKLDATLVTNSADFIAFLKEHKIALFYMHLAVIDDSDKKKILLNELKQFRLDSVFETLIDLLIVHRRLFLIPEVFAWIIEFYNKYNNRMDFTVTSSHELTPVQLQDISDFLKKQTGKIISLAVRIDPQLLAGIMISSSTMRWEYSVRKQLRALSRLD